VKEKYKKTVDSGKPVGRHELLDLGDALENLKKKK